jgi:sugar/nucleoside kinase (ribokinase family)
MATIAVIGSVACDKVVRLHQPLRAGGHQEGSWAGARLGGGAANTALPLARAGHHAVIVGAVGNDDVGRALVDALAAAGVDTRQIVTLDQPTTRSLVLIDPVGERTIVNLVRTTEEAPPVRLAAIGADCIYVRSRRSDLAPLLAGQATTATIVAELPPWEAGSRPAHVLIASAADTPADVLADAFAAGRRVAGTDLQWMIVTHGSAGATAYGADGVVHAAAPTVAAVDTTGAGDAFAAGLVHALVCGNPLVEALRTAVAWGAEATRWDGSSLPAEAVDRLLQYRACEPNNHSLK